MADPYYRKKHRRSPVLPLLLLAVAASLAIAGVWQLLSGPAPAEEPPFDFDPAIAAQYGLSSEAPAVESSEAPASQETPASQEASSEQQAPAASAAEPASAASGASEASSAPSEAPASSEPAPTDSAPADPEPAGEGSGLVYLTDARPVPASERVSSSYFDDAVFIGDSITTGIRLYDVMSNADVWASTGASLTNILTQELAEIDGVGTVTILRGLDLAQPGKIYLLLGANSLAASLDDVIAVYSSLLDQIIAHAPNAVVYVQSAFPINEPLYGARYNKVVTNRIIDDFNSRLLALCGQKGVAFLDVNSYFRDENGSLSDNFTSDGLHLHSAQYLDWFDYLKTHTVQ